MVWGLGTDMVRVNRVECSAPLVGDMVSVTSDRVRRVTPYRNFYARIQSANLRWPSKAERSVSMKHPRQISTTDNPLHIFYPPDNNNEQVTSHLLNNANTFHAKSFLIIVVLVFFLKS